LARSPARRREEAASLVHGERRPLDEDVAERSETLAPDGRNQVVGPQGQVSGPVVTELGWNDVGAKERGHQAHGLGFREPAIQPQQAELVLPVEAVAALALHGRHAEREHVAEEAGGAGRELLVAGGTGEPHGPRDPAAGRRDLEVTPSEQPLLELLRAPAAERQMGVAVHQARDDQAATRVEPGGAGVGFGDVGPRAYPENGRPLPHQRRVGNGVDLALPAVGAAGDELRNIVEEVHRVGITR
jgi:hypothetical protein